MRIAYVCQSYPPMVSGAANVVARLAAEIARRGHKILIIAASPEGPPYTQTTGNTEIAYLSSFHNPLRVGQRFIIWPRSELIRQLIAFKPDILHIEDPTLCSLLAISIRSIFPDLPYVMTAHQVPWFITGKIPVVLRNQTENILWKFGSYVYTNMTNVIVPSLTISKLAYDQTGKKTTVITNGIDTRRFTPRKKHEHDTRDIKKKYSLDPNLPVVLYVGRVDEEKRVDILIEIFSRVLEKRPAQLLIVGNGTKLNYVKAIASKKNLISSVRFPGYALSPDDLPKLYHTACVHVTASQVEIQSMAVLEASASGIPTVAFDTGSMPEMIADKKTGFLIPPGDLTKFADKIVVLVRNKSLASKMGKEARKFALSHNLEISVKKHISLYSSLLT